MVDSSFDQNKFLRAEFQPRMAGVQVPALQMFFAEGANPEFIVRSLTAIEMANAMEVAVKQKTLDTAIQAITSKREEIDQMRETLGINDDMNTEVAKRIEQLIVGCVNPVLERQTVIKLAERFPIEFYLLTNEIVKLTGLGMDIKKPEPFGKTTVSET